MGYVGDSERPAQATRVAGLGRRGQSQEAREEGAAILQDTEREA